MTNQSKVSTPLNVVEVLNALESWIKQRPGLDPCDYGCGMDGIRAYRSELRSIAQDKKRAMAALEEARGLDPQRPELLADSFRAFSGRLEWTPYLCPVCGEHTGIKTERTKDGRLIGYCGDAFPESKWMDGPYRLSYTTGQYWPTEYRKAAAAVLETYIADWRKAEATEHPQVFTYQTMEDVKAANRSIDNHWFDRDTMRYFHTRIESGLIGGRYFITSKRMVNEHPRRYSVRRADPDGTIDTVGEFHSIDTVEEAREVVRQLMKEAQ